MAALPVFMPNVAGSILVCFAIPEEARPFHKLLNAHSTRDRTGFQPVGVEVLVTGMGRHNTERALRAALAGGMPSRVLTCGFAGGLDPMLKLNDIVCATSDDTLDERLRAIGAHPVRFHCAARMVVTSEEKAALRQETGADAVEMESRWVQELCRPRGLPCATVRVISDTADETMPLDFNALTTSDLKMSYAKLGLALCRAPGKVPALLRLQRQTQAAARTLAAFLDRLLAEPAL